ncbi:MAG TPA: plastocyanin/azurin family copper-binding protein [Solirubrobacteraceae bacterium]|nr:plastocyanin/azurin family copper-binding protein [Solirubrobacteraceae bacterium]
MRIVIPTLIAAGLALAGCGSSSSPSSSTVTSSSSASSSASAAIGAATPPTPAGGTIQARMTNLAFSPKLIQARVGQSVHWVNDDSVPHNVTGTSGPTFTASPTFGNGGSFTLKLTKPGTIQYLCTIHPFMKATIVVRG